MYALQRVVTRSPKLLKVSENQCRTLLGTPPRERIPFAEKMAMGAVFWISVMATPLYIACHVRKYNEGSE